MSSKVALSLVPAGYVLLNNIGIRDIEHVSRYKNLLFHPGGIADSLRGKVLAEIDRDGTEHAGHRKKMYWHPSTGKTTYTRKDKTQLMVVSKVYLDANVSTWVEEYVNSRVSVVPENMDYKPLNKVAVYDKDGVMVGHLVVPVGGRLEVTS